MSDQTKRPWLLDLATQQSEGAQAASGAVYDEDDQITYVLQEPDYVAAIDASMAPQTKKADRETGEDQKAHW